MWLCMCVFVVGDGQLGVRVHTCVRCRLHAHALTEVWGVQYGVGGCLIRTLLLETHARQERLVFIHTKRARVHTPTHTLTKGPGSNVIMPGLVVSQLVKEDTVWFCFGGGKSRMAHNQTCY